MKKIAFFLATAMVIATGSGCGSDATDTGAAGTVAAPTLLEVAKMDGALHVSWKNNGSLDTIELERKMPGEAFQVVFTLPGEADNKHDTTATHPMDHTYRVRGKKAGTYTPYSNELAGNPTK